MSKKKSLNIKIIAPIVSVAVLGSLVGSYFIGYNVGKNNSIQGSGATVTTAVNADTTAHATVDYSDPYSNIVGVFQRSFYNNYNKSVESYVVFRDDNTCYYIDSVATAASTTVDFDDRSQECTYTFDENTRSGVFTVVYPGANLVNGVASDLNKDYNFTFDGHLMVGAASYGRIR